MIKILCVFLVLVLTGFPSVAETGEKFDWTGFNGLLQENVAPGETAGIKVNLVDYPALLENPVFAGIGKALAEYDPSTLEHKEKLAFYINAYNYFALKLVLDNWPVESIKDAGSLFSTVWKLRVGEINGQPVTLSWIEHDVLRKMGEPRIHFAIVCASLSCPDLRTEVYVAERLEEQLEDQLRSFLANEAKGLNVEGGKWYISKIFDWFEEDFTRTEDVDGEMLKGVEEFISSRMGLSPPGRVGYLNYDWSLNRKIPGPLPAEQL